jgi:enoyl-CoA hydratase
MVLTTIDIIFAAEDAEFLAPTGQYFSIPWDLGIRKAKEILFEPRFIGAHEAQALGFVNRVLPGDQLDSEVMAYADRVAENDPFYLRIAKLNINQAQDMQGYTTCVIATHGSRTREGGSSQGAQLPSGERRVAPIERALRNRKLTRGI